MTDKSSLQPRWLDRRGVAAYISATPRVVSAMARDGRLPEPVYLLGPRTPRWDRLAIDAAFGAMDEAQQEAEAERAIRAACAEIVAEGARRRRRAS